MHSRGCVSSFLCLVCSAMAVAISKIVVVQRLRSQCVHGSSRGNKQSSPWHIVCKPAHVPRLRKLAMLHSVENDAHHQVCSAPLQRFSFFRALWECKHEGMINGVRGAAQHRLRRRPQDLHGSYGLHGWRDTRKDLCKQSGQAGRCRQFAN